MQVEEYFRITKDSPHSAVYEFTPQQLRRSSRMQARVISREVDMDHFMSGEEMGDYWDCFVGGYTISQEEVGEIEREIEYYYG